MRGIYDRAVGLADTVDRAIMGHLDLVGSKKARHQIVVTSAAIGLVKSFVDIFDEIQSNRTYEITVEAGDPLYDIIQDILIEQTPKNKIKNLLVVSEEVGGGSRYDSDESIKREIRVTYNDDTTHQIIINGYRISIRTRTISEQFKNEITAESIVESRMKRRNKLGGLILTCSSLEAKEAVLTFLQEELDNRASVKRVGNIFVTRKYGGFGRVSGVPARGIGSVVLKRGQAERIMEDIKTFIRQEDRYVALAVPYHRGYLFQGPPGTGKSSIASAIAHEFGKDVYIINLSAKDSDDDLLDDISDIRPGSILLLEDIDVVTAVRDRDDEREGVTMTGILNVLDGILTPYGLITIMTTNDATNIDPAILRPGRIDLQECVDYADDYQIRRFCEVFLGFIPGDLPLINKDAKIVPASLSEIVKTHFDDPEEAGMEIVNLIKRANDQV